MFLSDSNISLQYIPLIFYLSSYLMLSHSAKFYPSNVWLLYNWVDFWNLHIQDNVFLESKALHMIIFQVVYLFNT